MVFSAYTNIAILLPLCVCYYKHSSDSKFPSHICTVHIYVPVKLVLLTGNHDNQLRKGQLQYNPLLGQSYCEGGTWEIPPKATLPHKNKIVGNNHVQSCTIMV